MMLGLFKVKVEILCGFILFEFSLVPNILCISSAGFHFYHICLLRILFCYRVLGIQAYERTKIKGDLHASSWLYRTVQILQRWQTAAMQSICLSSGLLRKAFRWCLAI